MKRGDFVTIALQGNFGKPRPALVIQADQFDAHATVTVLLVTSELVEAPLFRIQIEPDNKNGLQKTSQVMVDKTMTVKREKIGRSFGQLSATEMLRIERSLALFLGIAK